MRWGKIQLIQKTDIVIQKENQSNSELDLKFYYLSNGKLGDIDKIWVLSKAD